MALSRPPSFMPHGYPMHRPPQPEPNYSIPFILNCKHWRSSFRAQESRSLHQGVLPLFLPPIVAPPTFCRDCDPLHMWADSPTPQLLPRAVSSMWTVFSFLLLWGAWPSSKARASRIWMCHVCDHPHQSPPAPYICQAWQQGALHTSASF